MLNTPSRAVLNPIFKNIFGRVGEVISLPVAPVLGTPTVTDTTMILTWTMSNDTGVTDYIIEYKASSSGTWLVFSDGTSTSKTATVTGLSASTSYNARVKAVNASGESAYSNVQTISTNATAVQLNPMDESSVFAFYRADSGLNVINNYSSTFTADATTDTILPAVVGGFLDPVYPGGIDGLTPVRFTTTGTLPSPLQLNTDYYLSPTSGGNYEIYPVATEADIPNLNTAVVGENVEKGQNFFQQLNKINITNIGSGTHTVSTGTTLKTLTDIKSGFNLDVARVNDIHSHIARKSDGNGDIYIDTDGVLGKNDNGGSYNQHGKVMFMKTNKFVGRQQSAQKRYVYLMFMCTIKPMVKKNIRKCIIQSTGFNTSTNILTPTASRTDYNNGLPPFVTGSAVIIKALSGGTLAGGLTDGTTYYMRKINSTTYTLHPTSTDATNNTNIIDITSQGSGDMMIIEPLIVGDYKRPQFFMEWLAPDGGDNTLSARVNVSGPLSAGLFNASSFVTSGGNAGNINGLGFDDLDKVILWATPDATLPSPLQRDTPYWVSKVPGSGSGVCRLHTSLASATESVGVATSASSCIKFTTAGTGNVLFEYYDDKFQVEYGQASSGTNVSMGRIIKQNEKSIIFMAIDYNPDTGTTPIGYLKYNNSSLVAVNLAGTKGITGSALNDGSDPWTLFDSAQGHVLTNMNLYSTVMGSHASTPLTETKINQMMNYFASQYTIPSFTPIL